MIQCDLSAGFTEPCSQPENYGCDGAKLRRPPQIHPHGKVEPKSITVSNHYPSGYDFSERAISTITSWEQRLDHREPRPTQCVASCQQDDTMVPISSAMTR